MSGHPTTWTPERRDEFLSVLRASKNRREAAERLRVSMKSLDAGGLVYGVKPSDYLDRNAGRDPEPTPPPAPAAPEPPPVEWTGARPATDGTGLERRLILGDLHIPFHSLRACAVVIAIAKAIQPHVVIQMGDLFNMGAIPHHPRPFGGRENHRGAQIQALSFLDALGRAAPGARKLTLKGNHDDYGDEYEDENPEWAGMVASKGLGFDRIGWELVPRDSQPLVLGPVAYRHGYGGGEHFCKRYALDDGPQAGVRCIVVGHHHTFQRFHAKNGVECWGAGWLGESRHPTFQYAKNPRHWEVGFLVQDVIGDHVTTTPVRIENGAALYGGRLITQERAA